MKEDRRTARTKKLIFNAFLELIINKGYERVNVRDVAEQADIGRSTFYSHFNNKEEVLDGSLARLFDGLYECSEESELEIIVPATGICLHVKDSKIVEQVIALEFIALKFQEHLQIAIFKKLSKKPISGVSKTTTLMNSHMLAGSFMALLRTWVDSGMKETPEKIAEYYSDFLATSKFLPEPWTQRAKNR